MKIRFNHTIFSQEKTGGISRYFVSLIKELIKTKADVKVITFLHKNRFLNTLPKKYYNGFYLPNYPSLKFVEKLNNIKFNNSIKENNFIIHDTYYSPLIIKPRNSKKIITVHDLIHEKFKEFYRNHNLEIKKKKEAFKDCDYFICISENTKKDLIHFYNIETSRIKVIYHGANHLSEEFSDIHYDNDNPFILFVGKREKYKNFKFLLEGYSKSSIINKNFRLICFGGEKFNSDERSLIEELNISEKIFQINGDDNLLKSFYSKANALIVPSLYEGFGFSILEAMRLKCPIFCSEIDIFKEICNDNAIYFNPKNIDDFINKIETFLWKESYLKEITLKAYKESKDFTWKKNCEETLKIYKKLS